MAPSPSRRLAGALLALCTFTACSTPGDPPDLVAVPAPAGRDAGSVPGSDPGPSPVPGLEPQALADALAAPLPARTRSVAGPTADQVSLPGGERIWRIRVPAALPVRSSAPSISLDGVLIGPAQEAPELDALLVLTRDRARIRPGAAVTYRWGSGPAHPGGRLEVLG